MKPTGRAITGECHHRTVGGTCQCTPKCKKCGFGPHMGIHMGCKGDPNRAFGHEYLPKSDDGLRWLPTTAIDAALALPAQGENNDG